MKNIYCIVGPSGSGKTTIVEALQKKYGYGVVESYTTRPPRFDGESGYVFVSPAEFRELGTMCAHTLFDGYEYGVSPNSIEKNDLYVVDLAGAEALQKTYNGSKQVKVIGLTADLDVLVERIRDRGDSDEKIIKRLANDADAFKNLRFVSDIVLDSDVLIDDLCETIHYHIENFEYWAKHDFTLLDEFGREVSSSSHRYYTLDEALAGLQKYYPDGLPAGWTLRDDTAVATSGYIKAIKKIRPAFRSNMICVEESNAGCSQDGHTVVHFSYKDKNYYYREHNGQAWIDEDVRSVSKATAEEVLQNKITFLYKRLEALGKELEGEYSDGETAWAAQLEVKIERIEDALPCIEGALRLLRGEKEQRPDSLDNVIEAAKDISLNPQTGDKAKNNDFCR